MSAAAVQSGTLGTSTPSTPRADAAIVHVVPTSTSHAHRISNRAFVGLIVAIALAGMSLVLLVNTLLAQGSFTADRLDSQRAGFQVQVDALGAQVADSQSPEALARAARQLGLVPVPTAAFLRLSDGRIVGAATPATAPVRRTASVKREPQRAETTATADGDGAARDHNGSDHPRHGQEGAEDQAAPDQAQADAAQPDPAGEGAEDQAVAGPPTDGARG